jgi:predicted nucleic acid-binding protein
LILFCDSSALVKLYLQEDDSGAVRSQAAASELLAVCRIAWVEVMSALAKRARERPQDTAAIAKARERFEADWPRYLCLELTQELAELAGDYADTFALRAYDSVQLAAAELARRDMPGELQFACFDLRLIKAARVLGIEAA